MTTLTLPTHPLFKDLTGKTFHQLTVVEYAGKQGQKHLWRCRCECGREKTIIGTNLTTKTNPTKSCGCLVRPEDLTGRTFGKWSVVGLHGKKKNEYLWNCRCECGTQRALSGSVLKSGRSSSCGGCRQSRHENLTGQSFGYWLVISDLGRSRWGYHFLCRCVCGRERSVRGSNLKNGWSMSCGCQNWRHRRNGRHQK